MPKVEKVPIATLDLSGYDLEGSLDEIIEQFKEYRIEAARRGLVNPRASCDWHEEPIYGYGGYTGERERKWTMEIHGEKVTLTEAEKCVHTEHCCLRHGCKYGDEDCPVATGKKKQSYPCETCYGF